jgi:predicted metal-binding transcription factor (methanogenesis marker protein 9)
MQETITISKEEYLELKKKAESDEILEDFKKSFEDLKNKRIIKVR